MMRPTRYRFETRQYLQAMEGNPEDLSIETMKSVVQLFKPDELLLYEIMFVGDKQSFRATLVPLFKRILKSQKSNKEYKSRYQVL